MLDDTRLPPQPPVPRRWAPIIWSVLIVGLVIAFVAIPSFRHSVLSGWDVTKAFFKKLFGF